MCQHNFFSPNVYIKKSKLTTLISNGTYNYILAAETPLPHCVLGQKLQKPYYFPPR